MNKCAVFSCQGLGDGLIALVLSNNLRINGAQVTTFHPFLQGLQSWFPGLPIQPFPSLNELSHFDGFFIIYEKTSWMQEILAYLKQHSPEKTHVLNPIATDNRDYPYWEVGKFEGRRTFVDNIVSYCKNTLSFSCLTKDNGIRAPENVRLRQFQKRVILHPTSSRLGKNWTQEKFIILARDLKEHGFEPLFILNEAERDLWNLSEIFAPSFSNLYQLAQWVGESSYMIGNDSGIGHLASCLGIPTVTLCRNYQTARFWRPAWAKGKVIAPYPWIPNIKMLRLRDRYWKKWITPKRVLKHFLNLQI